MEANFAKSLAFVLGSEGGNDDDPDDHGGRTSRGITQREYDAWRAEQDLEPQDVWSAAQSEIIQIYHDDYWLPWCPAFPTGTDYLFFDMNVNAGPHEAIVLLQWALGVSDDGRIGPVTRRALKNADPRTLILNYTLRKMAFYKALHQPRFIKGWLNRCRDVQSNAISMLPPKLGAENHLMAIEEAIREWCKTQTIYGYELSDYVDDEKIMSLSLAIIAKESES